MPLLKDIFLWILLMYNALQYTFTYIQQIIILHIIHKFAMNIMVFLTFFLYLLMYKNLIIHIIRQLTRMQILSKPLKTSTLFQLNQTQSNSFFLTSTLSRMDSFSSYATNYNKIVFHSSIISVFGIRSSFSKSVPCRTWVISSGSGWTESEMSEEKYTSFAASGSLFSPC